MKKLLSIITLLGLVSCGSGGKTTLPGNPNPDSPNGVAPVLTEYAGFGLYLNETKLGIISPLSYSPMFSIWTKKDFIVNLWSSSSIYKPIPQYGSHSPYTYFHNSNCSGTGVILRSRQHFGPDVIETTSTTDDGSKITLMVDKDRESYPSNYFSSKGRYDDGHSSFICDRYISRPDMDNSDVLIINDKNVSGWDDSLVLNIDELSIRYD